MNWYLNQVYSVKNRNKKQLNWTICWVVFFFLFFERDIFNVNFTTRSEFIYLLQA